MIIEPFLFGLVGSEIRIDYLKPNIVGLGLATLFFGIAARMLAAFASAFSAGLTLKEQIFVTFAGLPKATVQIYLENYIQLDRDGSAILLKTVIGLV
ncbi:hypothetical protein AVEN_88497-1 [Araneus ventricosus]|uniref:Cation/H+ exchanger transmembrane domain-containing protein n=1 Tax=Araneus ventricosus TaxID=182803 RepID=A0A4Y2CV96_ARAVE|nr:hypothetical protein AVEN_88497-1 [Araneus ventricosus]